MIYEKFNHHLPGQIGICVEIPPCDKIILPCFIKVKTFAEKFKFSDKNDMLWHMYIHISDAQSETVWGASSNR